MAAPGAAAVVTCDPTTLRFTDTQLEDEFRGAKLRRERAWYGK